MEPNHMKGHYCIPRRQGKKRMKVPEQRDIQLYLIQYPLCVHRPKICCHDPLINTLQLYIRLKMRTRTPCSVTYCLSLKKVQGPKRVNSLRYCFRVIILLKISEVDVPVLVNYDDDELHQLLRNVHLEGTETNDGGNGNDGSDSDAVVQLCHILHHKP